MPPRRQVRISAAPIFRLHVLGPVTVRAASDPPTASRVTQPRQLALLCYLALQRPRGVHSRDTLVALCWPEHDEARGRRALRNALHGLRRLLGACSIISVGDQYVGLDPASISCDVIELERHASLATVSLGTSTLEPLEGLHVRGAAAFDRWMDGERSRIRALLATRRSNEVGATAPTTRTRSRGPHAADAHTMYLRGHYLFLRAADGGSLEDLRRCHDYFQRALITDPTFAPAHAGLSNYYAVAARRGVLTPFLVHFERAIECARRALALDPSLAIPHVHFGVKALYLDDDFDRAGLEFATAAELEPEYAEGHRFHAVWLGLAGRPAEALRASERAVELEPDIPHMTSSLGAARLAAGDPRGAEEALRRTLALGPHHAPARARLIRLLEDEGRLKEAVAERTVADPAGAERFARALASDGPAGYHEALQAALRAEAEALEARILAGATVAVNDIFSPPVVRLIALHARLGDWRRVRSWRLQAIATRPELARWIDTLPELAASVARGAVIRSGPR